MAIEKDLLDQLLAGRDPKDVFNKDGLVDELKKALSERILNAEIDEHLDGDGGEAKGNHRNGYSKKSVLTGTSKMTLSVRWPGAGRKALIPNELGGHMVPLTMRSNTVAATSDIQYRPPFAMMSPLARAPLRSTNHVTVIEKPLYFFKVLEEHKENRGARPKPGAPERNSQGQLESGAPRVKPVAVSGTLRAHPDRTRCRPRRSRSR
jgi:putative transposase